MRAPLASVLPECRAHIPLYRSIKSDFICIAQVRENQFPANWVSHSLQLHTRSFLPAAANIWGGKTQKNKNLNMEKRRNAEESCRGGMLLSRTGRHAVGVTHCIQITTAKQRCLVHTIYIAICVVHFFCFHGALSHANFCLGVSQKPLAGFQIITIMHAFKSFCFGIKSHSFTDFEQMFCTLRRKMAAQQLDQILQIYMDEC